MLQNPDGKLLLTFAGDGCDSIPSRQAERLLEYYGMHHHRSTATIRESRKLKGTHFRNHESAGAEKGADWEPAMRFGLNLRDPYLGEFPICSSSRESNPFFSLDL